MNDRPVLVRLSHPIAAAAGDYLLIEGGTARVVDVALPAPSEAPRRPPRAHPEDRGLDVLACFQPDRERTLHDVARALRLHPTTASGWCAKLVNDGVLVRVSRGRFRQAPPRQTNGTGEHPAEAG